MLVDNYKVEPLNGSQYLLSWESESDETVSWIFINGRFYMGPFMAETTNRSMEIPFRPGRTLVIEIHDFESLETVPDSIEQRPLVKPLIGWNTNREAKRYRIYHGVFDGAESLIETIQNMPLDRIEIDCPIRLEGRGGRWHYFRVESVDRFGNESESGGNLIPHFAADLPDTPEVHLLRDPESGLFTFTIGA